MRPAFSLRGVPPAIYLAIGINALGTLAMLVAITAQGGEGSYEDFLALTRWRMLDTTCWTASIILLSLGFFDLAKRHVGSARTLTNVAASLQFVGLTWLVASTLITLVQPQGDLHDFYDWLGRGIGMMALVAGILLTLGADAWRRVPLAASALVLLHCTSSWVPIIGPGIRELIGKDRTLAYAYAVARDCGFGVAYMFIAGALAAGGRPQPDGHAAAGGFRMARGALLARLFAAIGLAFVMLAIHDQTGGKLVMFAGPLVTIATMVVFALGIQRAAASHVEGIPRWRLAIGSAATLWWIAIQHEQVMTLYTGGHRLHADEARFTDLFTIAGPIVATLGVALVGSAIATFAANRGNQALAGSASVRTIAFVVLSLGAVGAQTLATQSESVGTTLGLVLLAVVAGIAALVVLVGVLRDAAVQVETVQGLPPARVV